MNIEQVDIHSIKDYDNNPRKNDDAVDYVKESIREFGFKNPIIIDKNNEIIAGHTRKKAALELGIKEVPVIKADDLTDEQVQAFRLADNKVAEFSEWDMDKLEDELNNIDIDMEDLGFTMEDLVDEDDDYNFEDEYNESRPGSLIEDYVISPFSILDTKQGKWLERRRAWKELGIRSEVGRGENLLFSKNLTNHTLGGTSIFDPVLCEIMYKWYTPNENSKVIDCFAGGSVRGVVAEQMGHEYYGVDLREEQIESNYDNAKEIGCNIDKLHWFTGDSTEINSIIEEDEFDFMLTCPPYHDLEVYSDEKNDISNVSYDEFVELYTTILTETAKKLKDNRFAVVVISDIRDKDGFYRDLTGDTKRAMAKEGFYLYNDLILANSIGTGALRARRSMKNRKNVRVHQNVIVFYKGDPKEIQNNFPAIEVPDDMEDEKIEGIDEEIK